MTKEVLDLIKELFEMIKTQKEYSDVKDQKITNLQQQINRKK